MVKSCKYRSILILLRYTVKFLIKIDNNMYIFGGYESENGAYSKALYSVDLKNVSNNEVIVSEVKIKTNI